MEKGGGGGGDLSYSSFYVYFASRIVYSQSAPVAPDGKKGEEGHLSYSSFYVYFASRIVYSLSYRWSIVRD